MGRTAEVVAPSPKVPLPPRVCEFRMHSPRCKNSQDLITCEVCDLVVCRTHSDYCECCETRRCLDCHGEHLPDCNPFGSSGQLDPYDDMFEDMERGKAGAA